MKPTVSYEEVLANSQKRQIGFVDVRSPKEYQSSTIPGAVNIPVLDNKAREKVGKLYVNGQIDEAKHYGVTWISEHLPLMHTQYQELLKEHEELVIFCSRGGMRSNSIFSLLKALGMPVSRLNGGYKAYRHYINEHLDEQISKVHFVTLYGLSGSGKTDILQELAKKGVKVLDLEACANHRGSLLGSVGLSAPHTQKMFESLLYETSQTWQEGDIVFTEGESKRIGKAVLPPSLVTGIHSGKKIYIDASLEKRVAQIHKDYVKENNKAELAQSLEPLKSFINEERIGQYQELIQKGNVDAVIESLLLSYYDPRYSYRKTQPEKGFKNENAEETAQAILDWERESRKKEQ